MEASRDIDDQVTETTRLTSSNEENKLTRKLSSDSSESPKRKSLQFWQNQEQESIRVRSTSFSKSNLNNSAGTTSKTTITQKLRSTSFSSLTARLADLPQPLVPSSPPLNPAARFNKLVSLTGRKDSLADIEPFLNPKTQEEATVMGQKIVQSDKMKQIYGTRPPAMPKLERNKSLEKLGRLTGRTDSLQDISEYLEPRTPDEAQKMGRLIEKSDRMKKVFGERPRSPTSEDVDENQNNNNKSVNVENVTQVITEIIKENQDLKVRTSTLSEKVREEEEKRKQTEDENQKLQNELAELKKKLEMLQNGSK